MGGGRLASALDVQSSSFLIKENRICAVAKHHAEPNMNVLLTSNLPFDSDVRQWRHPLMIPLYCLWVKSNNRTRAQFECVVNWFCFYSGFVRLHVWCCCCSIVYFYFQVVQIKQLDCKMSTKMCIVINKRQFVIFLNNCTHKNINPWESR